MNYIFLDIETVPNPDTFMHEEAAQAVSPPANYKSPEAIAKWWAENGTEAAQKAQHALGMHPAYLRIVAVSYALNDGEPRSYQGSEKELLQCFWDDLALDVADVGLHNVKYVGHNIAGFDLPAIWWACIRHRLPYALLPFPQNVKPWDTHSCVDTLWQISRGNFKGFGLANMAKLFNWKSDCPDVEGSQVWELWRNQQFDKIADYCEDDVRLVRQLFHQIKGYI